DFDPRGFLGRWADVVRVDSDCRPNFERADAPTVVQPECDVAKGELVIPADRGVTYKVRTATRDYRTVRAGEYDVRPGGYRVPGAGPAAAGRDARGSGPVSSGGRGGRAVPAPAPSPPAD